MILLLSWILISKLSWLVCIMSSSYAMQALEEFVKSCLSYMHLSRWVMVISKKFDIKLWTYARCVKLLWDSVSFWDMKLSNDQLVVDLTSLTNMILNVQLYLPWFIMITLVWWGPLARQFVWRTGWVNFWLCLCACCFFLLLLGFFFPSSW